jgi:heme-degrading monooxygenase HmoA
MIALADRSSGKMIGITFWESEDAMRQSAEAANRASEARLRHPVERRSLVEQFEVVADTLASTIG